MNYIAKAPIHNQTWLESNGVELSLTQVRDDLLLTADGIQTTLKDVDKGEFLAANVIDFI